TMRRFFVRTFFQRHARDHFTAAVPGRGRLENFRATIEHSNSGWRAHFVTGEGEKIATDLLNIQRHVSDALSGIDQGNGANRARLCAKIDNGINGAERIGNVSESE